MKLLGKTVTFRSWLNKLSRIPRRVTFEKLSTEVVIETQFYGKK